LVSDILESNGSSSMATVCGGSLAMMDAGVPLKSPLRRYRDGLGRRRQRQIRGHDRHCGRGRSLRRHGLSKLPERAPELPRFRWDIKVGGISIPMMREALAQAKKARLEILDIMDATLSEARTVISAYAPRLFKLSIPTDKFAT